MKLRTQVAPQDQWDLTPLYPNLQAWEKDFEELAVADSEQRWPEIARHQGKLGEGADQIKKALEATMKIARRLEKLYTYAHLKHDEDITQDDHKKAFSKISVLMNAFQQAVSWFDPELLALPEEKLKKLISAPELAEYRFYLDRITRLKPHTLSSREEMLLAMAGQPLQTSYKAFNALSDADINFGTVEDSQGKSLQITHGQYAVFQRSQDRTLRQRSFEQYHKKYQEFENTLCQLLIGRVESNVFAARARGYKSALEAALFPNQIDISVYHALIEAVNRRLPSLHRYIEFRKDRLGVDELHLYDLYVPLVTEGDAQFSYDEAEETIIASVAPLGSSYYDTLKEGLTTARWVDKFENKNKRSGGYSSGCYDSHPYILMNYKGIMRDVYTLAHEAGHSMHSWLSRRHQPYHYADYPIFVAEVASTFNEELLFDHLLKTLNNREQRLFLINQRIEDIRATLFRQTMFTEFELFLHTMVENNHPLTPQVIKDEYLKLNKKYFGDAIIIDPAIASEWSRIPHFYYNFYVYQYATGISASLALFQKVQGEGEPAVKGYLNFLKGGSSRFPIDLLADAGVDVRTAAPVLAAIDTFDRLINELATTDSIC